MILFLGVYFVTENKVLSNSDVACYQNVVVKYIDEVKSQCMNGSWSEWKTDANNPNIEKRVYTGQMGIYKYSLLGNRNKISLGRMSPHDCAGRGGMSNYNKKIDGIRYDYRNTNRDKVKVQNTVKKDLHSNVDQNTQIIATTYVCQLEQTRQKNDSGIGTGTGTGTGDDISFGEDNNDNNGNNNLDNIVVGNKIGETVINNNSNSSINNNTQIACSLDKLHWVDCQSDIFKLLPFDKPLFVKTNNDSIECVTNQSWSIVGNNTNPKFNILRGEQINFARLRATENFNGIVSRTIHTTINTCKGAVQKDQNIRMKATNLDIKEI